MWNPRNQRIRSTTNSKRRDREKTRRSIHIKRLNAHLEVITHSSVEQSEVRLLLNDLSPRGVGLYSPRSLPVGQEIHLVITEPKQIKIRARVTWHEDSASSNHILSSQSFSHRIGLEFIQTPDEEKVLQNFCDEVAKNYLEA